MKRGISTSVIILVVYAVIFILFDFIIPTYFRSLSYYSGFFPFFFFFPFMFGRGLRSGSRNYGNSQNSKQPEDDVLNGNYDASQWEKKNRSEYDEFGIPVKKVPSRTWYYVGIAALFAVSMGILIYRGLLVF